MTEWLCIRGLIAGIVLVAVGLLLPETLRDWMRAVPVVIGALIVAVTSFCILRLYRRDAGND